MSDVKVPGIGDDGAFTVPFSEEFQKPSVFDLPLLKLEKEESAVITMPKPQPRAAFTHWVNPITSYVICRGNYQTLMDVESDPEACPLCSVASPGRDVSVAMPRRRFVIPVLQYSLGRNRKPATPIMVNLIIWRFGERNFNRLVTASAQVGDIRKYDIVITCTNAAYQNFDITTSAPKAATYLRAEEDERNRIISFFKDNEPSESDLTRLLGRRMEPEQMENVVRRIGNGGMSSSSAPDTPEFDEPETQVEPDDVEDFDDLLDVGSLLD